MGKVREPKTTITDFTGKEPPKADKKNYRRSPRMAIPTTHYSAKVARMLLLGHSRDEILEVLEGIKPEGAAKNWVPYIYAKGYEKYENYQNANIQKIATQNLNKIQGIIDEGIAAKDWNLVLKALDMVNKMAGMYETKTNVKVTTDEPIVIKFE